MDIEREVVCPLHISVRQFSWKISPTTTTTTIVSGRQILGIFDQKGAGVKKN